MRPKRVRQNLSLSLSLFLSLCFCLRNRARMTEQSNRLLNKRCRPTCRTALFAVLLFFHLCRDARTEKYMTSDTCIRWTSITSAWWNLSQVPYISVFRLTSMRLLIFTFDFHYVIVFTLENRFFFLTGTSGWNEKPLIVNPVCLM